MALPKLVILVLSKVIIWSVILYQALKLGLLFVLRYKEKFWLVKDRPNPPKCLSDEQNGRHFFIETNVSIIFYKFVLMGS